MLLPWHQVILPVQRDSLDFLWHMEIKDHYAATWTVTGCGAVIVSKKKGICKNYRNNYGKNS